MILVSLSVSESDMSIKHATQTTKTNNPNYDVSADAWNAAHTLDDQSITMNNLSGHFHGATAIVGTDSTKDGLTNYWYADGIADDVQLQAACTYVAGLGGGTVYIEAGDYQSTADVELGGDNVHIQGAGIGATHITCSDAGTGHDVFSMDNRDYCSIRDLSIDGARGTIAYPTPPTVPPRALHVTAGGHHNVYERVYIYSHADAFGIDYGDYNSIINCYGRDNLYVGVAIGSNTAAQDASHNMVQGGYYWDSGTNGIEIFGANFDGRAMETLIYGVKSHDNTVAGIDVPTTASHVNIVACDLYNNAEGVKMYNTFAYALEHIQIVGCKFYSNSNTDISLSVSTSGTALIQWVKITDNDAYDSPYFVNMQVEDNADIQYVKIADNTWEGVTTHGINGGITAGTITDINITGNVGAGAGSGVTSWNNDYWQIIGNNFRGHAAVISRNGANDIVQHNQDT
jgi:hypothetical protein